MTDLTSATQGGAARQPPRDAMHPGARILVAAIVVSIGMSVLAATIWRPAGPGTVRIADAPIIQYRDVTFTDLPGGLVVVKDAVTGAQIVALQRGEGAFLRSTIRGLVQERRRSDFDAELPFRVARHGDDRITLEDTATGRLIPIRSFGQTQVEAFKALLPNEGTTK